MQVDSEELRRRFKARKQFNIDSLKSDETPFHINLGINQCMIILAELEKELKEKENE